MYSIMYSPKIWRSSCSTRFNIPTWYTFNYSRRYGLFHVELIVMLCLQESGNRLDFYLYTSATGMNNPSSRANPTTPSTTTISLILSSTIFLQKALPPIYHIMLLQYQPQHTEISSTSMRFIT